MKKLINSAEKHLGFTLVEMAIVLVIVGLLVAAFLTPLSAQIEQRNYIDTENSLQEIKEALIGYASSHGHFPCPAVSPTNGAEDRTLTVCTGGKRVGILPWSELGVPQLDSWGHLYRYSVTLAYADSGIKINLSPLTASDITITTRDNAGNPQNLSNINTIPVAIMSVGKNGAWGYSNTGAQVADTSATNVDEDANGNGNGRTFVNRFPTTSAAIAGGEFDDIAVWISTNIYLNRMIAAGQLP